MRELKRRLKRWVGSQRAPDWEVLFNRYFWIVVGLLVFSGLAVAFSPEGAKEECDCQCHCGVGRVD
jgi:hypothetical protein